MKRCNIISLVFISVLLLVVSGCQSNEPPENGVENTNNAEVILNVLTPTSLTATPLKSTELP
jgi:hypothetical protein